MIRIALAGSFATGKSDVLTVIEKVIKDDLGVEPITLPNAPQVVGASTLFNMKDVDNDEFQLYSTFFRRMWELQGLGQENPVLSGGCALNDVAYQKYRVDKLATQGTGLIVPNGQNLTSNNQAMGMAALSALQVLTQQAALEGLQYWHFIYHTPLPGGSISDNGIRSTSTKYQADIEENLKWIIQALGSSKIRDVPLDPSLREAFFKKELEEWKSVAAEETAANKTEEV